MYTIKEASTRTGVSVPVLRAWQRRYGIVDPARTRSGYRLYDDRDVERIVAMRRLVDSGWSPSAAASALLDGSAPSPTAARPAAAAPADRGDDRVHRFVDAAAALDIRGLEAVLDDMFAAGSFERIAEELLLPALHAVGDAWATGMIDVGAEHAASSVVHRRLGAAFQAAGRAPAPDGVILVGMPPGARHELGALAFSVAARRAGLPVVYLGADLPVDDWVATANRTHAAAVVIGAVAKPDGVAAAGVARRLREVRPEMLVGLGGAAAPKGIPGTMVLPASLREAVDAVRAAIGSTSAPTRAQGPSRGP